MRKARLLLAFVTFAGAAALPSAASARDSDEAYKDAQQQIGSV